MENRVQSLFNIRYSNHILLFDVHFVEEVSGSTELVYDEQHVADIHIDASLKIWFEDDVSAHGFPVAVKSQSDKFTLGVEHVTSGVSAGDVVVGEEA